MLYSQLIANVKKHPDKIALQIKRGEQYVRYAYRDVADWARRFAAHLKQVGITPGDRVALWAENTPEWCLAYLGIHLAGAVAIPLDVQYQDNSVIHLLKFVGAKAIIYGPELKPKVQKVLAELPIIHLSLDLEDKAGSLFAAPPVAEDFSVYQSKPDDVMSIIFTSGTTGDPKGVMLTVENFFSNIRAMLKAGLFIPDEVSLCVLPLHHCYAFSGNFLTPILNGSTVTFQPILKGPAIMSAMQETGVTMMIGVPQLFNMFAKAMQENIQKLPWWQRLIFAVLYRLSRRARIWFGWKLGKKFFGKIHQRFGPAFRTFISGGAKLDKEVCEFFWNLGLPVQEGYGLTETSPVLTYTPGNGFRPGSAGIILAGVDLRIDKPDADGIGEIVMRGPNLMKGYYQNEQATKEVIVDGWFHTGDLGYLDKKGYLFITGRAKELIVLESGKKVHPEEPEKHYQKATLAAEVCIIGEKKPDGSIGSLTALVYPNFDEVKRRKIHNLQGDLKFEIETLALQLPTYLRPNAVKIVTEPFPRTRLGKLKRNLIAQTRWQEYQAEDKDITSLNEEERRLLSKPSSEKLLARLKDLTQTDKEIFPSDSLDLDLGIGSLKRMELMVKLEQEFGLHLTPEQIAALITVKDILQVLPDSAVTGQSEFSWSSLIRKKPEPPLAAIFNLQRGWFKNFVLDMVRWGARIIFRLCFGLKLKKFAQLLSYQGPALITPTHQSMLDAAFMYVALPSKIAHRTVFIAYAQRFEQGVLSWLIRPCRVIKTGSSSTSISSLQYAAEALAQGWFVCVFPEGQRSPDAKICQPMSGPGMLACEYQAPMIPVIIQGSMATYSRSNPGFHLANVTMEVLSPIAPPKKDQFTEEDYRQAVQAWYKVVSAIVK